MKLLIWIQYLIKINLYQKIIFLYLKNNNLFFLTKD